MAIIVKTKKKFGGTTFTSGSFYSFKYKGWENDPEPMIIFINSISGIHENTGNQHRYIQGINLNYIQRDQRKKFIETYLKERERNVNLKFTWQKIGRSYSYIQWAIRRYFYMPKSYIKNLNEIDTVDIMDIGCSTHILSIGALIKT